MYCTQCGAEVEEAEKFCALCGTVVKHVDVEIGVVEDVPAGGKHADTKGALVWEAIKDLGITIVLFVVLCGAVLYGLSLYSSCNATGTATIPVIGYVFECERTPEEIEQAEHAAFIVRLQQQDLERTATPKVSSPYDSVQCIGADYQLRIVLIPHDDSPQGITTLKTYQDDIISYVRKIKFPIHLFQGRTIGIVSPIYKGGTVTLGGRTYEVSAGSGNQHAGVYGDGTMFLYGSALGDRLHAALAHELGHLIGNTFTTGDWVDWARVRGERNSMGTLGSEWALSFEEDFAEEFKRYVGGYQGDPSIWGNHTAWGEGGYFYRELVMQKTLEPASADVQEFIKTRLARLKSLDAQTENLGSCRP